MSKKYQKRREWTLTDENDLRAAWEARPLDQTGTQFGRSFATKVQRSSAAVDAKRCAMRLRVRPERVQPAEPRPPRVRVCHARTVDVCQGLPGEEQGGGPMCCNCIEGFDLPDIRVVLEDS